MPTKREPTPKILDLVTEIGKRIGDLTRDDLDHLITICNARAAFYGAILSAKIERKPKRRQAR